MKMYTKAFNQLREAEQFVNENNIPKKDIVTIIPEVDGTFAVIYYAD